MAHRIIQKTKHAAIYSLLIGLMAFQGAQPASAEADLLNLLEQGVDYYIPGDVCGGASPTAAGASTLPADFNTAIDGLKSMYQIAADANDIPWQVLAGIHYRESGFATNKDLQAGNPFGGPYSQASTSYAQYGYPADLQQSLDIAAKELQAKAQAGIFHKKITKASVDSELIKDALFGYNGRAEVYKQQAARLGFNPETQPYEGSPYVMNRFDAAHTDMGIITTDFGKMDGIDKRFGAYTIYVGLGGPQGGAAATGASGCGAGVSVSGDFDKLLLDYAWHDYKGSGFMTRMPAYIDAISAAANRGEYTGGCSGVDCGAFVTLLLRNSGTDPEYNKYEGPVTEQYRWVNDHPEKYRKFKATDSSQLHKGDVWINASQTHTYIFVGDVPGFNSNSASASLCDRAPMAEGGGAYDFDQYWYELIK